MTPEVLATNIGMNIDMRFKRIVQCWTANSPIGMPFNTCESDKGCADPVAAAVSLEAALNNYLSVQTGDTLYWRRRPSVEQFSNGKWNGRARLYVGNKADELPDAFTAEEGVNVVEKDELAPTGEQNAHALAEPLRAYRDKVVKEIMNPDLPRWRCHKVVQADKIATARTKGTGVEWVLACGAVIHVSKNLAGRAPAGLSAHITGYYVRYEDGHESWSPAQVFEDGYTRIQDPDSRTCAACVGTGKSGFIHPFVCPSCNGTGRVRV